MAPRLLYFFALILVLCNTFITYANDTISIPKVYAENFDSLIKGIEKESTSYQDFKLVKKSDIDILKTSYKVEEASFKNTIVELQTKNNELEEKNKELITQNKIITEKYNSLLINSQNSSAKIYIIIIAVLLLLFVYMLYKYNLLSDLYKSKRNSIELVESEFEDYKRIAIEREQKIKRELINVKNLVQDTGVKKTLTIVEDKIEKQSEAKNRKIDLDEILAKSGDPNAIIISKLIEENDFETEVNVLKFEPIKTEKVIRDNTKKRKG